MKRQRDHLDIEVLGREVRRLHRVEATWAALDPEDRVAFRAEWHNVMDVFGHLVAASEAGRLDDDDTRDLRGLAADLASALPALERMRLRTPDADLLARLRLAATS